MRFIKPCQPVLRASPPLGSDWLHELKLDGFRAQLHRIANHAALYSRNGYDMRLKGLDLILEAARQLECRSCVLDAELIAVGEDGLPDFNALLRRQPRPLSLVVFDVLDLNGEDMRDQPLEERRKALETLARDPGPITLSPAFDDPAALLRECEHRWLEGIVSKRRGSRYVSGTSSRWIKVKSTAWREANRERHELFQ